VASGQVKVCVVGTTSDPVSFGVEHSPWGRSLAAGASFTLNLGAGRRAIDGFLSVDLQGEPVGAPVHRQGVPRSLKRSAMRPSTSPPSDAALRR
jgi:hypothetical protein